MKRILIVICLVFIIFNLYSQSDFRDYSFGNLGFVSTDFNGDADVAYAVDVQSDGRIVVAGYSADASCDFAVSRYLINGNPDDSFGTDGKVKIDFGGYDWGISIGMDIQTDGKIVVSGCTDVNGSPNFAIARLNTDGTLDNSFGTNGLVITNLGGLEEIANKVLIQPDGKILAAGYHYAGATYEFALVRYNTDGNPDNSFGTNGVVITDLGAYTGEDQFDVGYAIDLMSDNKIVIGGYSLNTFYIYDIALACYNTDGTLYSGFGTNGFTLLDLGSVDYEFIQDIEIQDDDKVVFVGSSNGNGTNDLAIGRLNSDGTVDNTFSGTGFQLINIGENDYGIALKIQDDGKIIAVGRTDVNSDGDFLLMRFNPNGSIDNYFGNSGYLISDFYGMETARDVFIQDNDRIIVVGDIENDGSTDFAIARYFGINNIQGVVYDDLNLNGIQDAGEQGVAGHLLKLEPGSVYTSSSNSGNFYYFADLGNYDLSYITEEYWIMTSAYSEYSLNVSDVELIQTGFDFGVTPKLNIHDVAVEYTSNAARPGFQTYCWLSYKNYGTTTESGVISLEYDEQLIFIESDISPISHIDNVIQWEYDTLASGESRNIFLRFQVDASQQIDDTLIYISSISPFIGDTVVVNNYDTLNHIVTGSYDPNDKAVEPAGISNQGYVLHDEELTYTVRFQNTGSDTAFNITIIDTVSAAMNIESFQWIASSHEMGYFINTLPDGRNLLIFQFDNIFLPDSNVNEVESHGFVKFNIEPKNGLPDYTQVENSASIYFDFNDPIITNQVLNTYVSVIPTSVDVLADKFKIYPNPTTGIIEIDARNIELIELYNLHGQLLYSGKGTQIDLSPYPKGVYLVKVTTDKVAVTEKVILE